MEEAMKGQIKDCKGPKGNSWPLGLIRDRKIRACCRKCNLEVNCTLCKELCDVLELERPEINDLDYKSLKEEQWCHKSSKKADCSGED